MGVLGKGGVFGVLITLLSALDVGVRACVTCFIVLSGFATSDLSVDFCDARQGGGAYGKTASPWPYLFFAKCLPGIFQEISVPVRKPVPLAAAERPSVASQ